MRRTTSTRSRGTRGRPGSRAKHAVDPVSPIGDARLPDACVVASASASVTARVHRVLVSPTRPAERSDTRVIHIGDHRRRAVLDHIRPQLLVGRFALRAGTAVEVAMLMIDAGPPPGPVRHVDVAVSTAVAHAVGPAVLAVAETAGDVFEIRAGQLAHAPGYSTCHASDQGRSKLSLATLPAAITTFFVPVG